MIKWLRNLFLYKPVTVDSLTKTFSKTIDALDLLIVEKGQDMLKHGDEIARLQTEQREARAEADRAWKVRNNIEAIIKGN